MVNHLGQNEYTWQLNLLFVIVIALIVFIIIRLIYKSKKENMQCEMIEIPAILVFVETSVSGNAMIGRRSRNMDMSMPHSRKKAIFQFEDGDSIELFGDDDLLDFQMIGKKGRLKYQGSKLISFE